MHILISSGKMVAVYVVNSYVSLFEKKEKKWTEIIHSYII